MKNPDTVVQKRRLRRTKKLNDVSLAIQPDDDDFAH
jgi:hypothetical protein